MEGRHRLNLANLEIPAVPRKLLLPLNRTCRYGASRRRFLQSSAAALVGLSLANCRQNLATSPTVPASPTPTAADSNTLYVYTWANYTDPDLINQFTSETGLKVVVDIYDSNETMLAKLQAGGGNAYSIIYPSDYMVAEMQQSDLLSPLDPARLQGMENLLDQWKDPVYDPGNGHSVPFSWGTTGLLYNREAVSGPPTDWNVLWDQKESLARRISLLDDMRETLGATLKSLGYSYNATDPKQLEAAYKRLLELKPYLAAFKTSGYEDEVIGGDLYLVMSYSSDAIPVIQEDDRLAYLLPASGSSLWTDTMAIPKTAPNPDGAYAWINFLLRPEIAKAAVERMFFATPNHAAYEQLSEQIKSNQSLYPPEDLLAKCEGIAPVGKAIDIYDSYWTQVTSA